MVNDFHFCNKIRGNGFKNSGFRLKINKKSKLGWQSKKLQMQGEQILRNEAHLRGTPE